MTNRHTGTDERGRHYVKLSRDILRRRDLTASAKLVYCGLLAHGFLGDGEWPSIRSLASYIGRSKNTVLRALRALASAGLIERTSGRGTETNEYRLAQAEL